MSTFDMSLCSLMLFSLSFLAFSFSCCISNCLLYVGIVQTKHIPKNNNNNKIQIGGIGTNHIFECTRTNCGLVVPTNHESDWDDPIFKFGRDGPRTTPPTDDGGGNDRSVFRHGPVGTTAGHGGDHRSHGTRLSATPVSRTQNTPHVRGSGTSSPPARRRTAPSTRTNHSRIPG